jgi:crooked neck
LLEETKQQVLRSRGIFERAFESLRTTAPEQKEERAMLLEEWRDTEASFADLGDVATVQRKMPRRVKRKRPISSEDGTPAGFEEYTDYIFPEETGMAPNLKILEAAYKWKKQKVGSDEDD